MFRPVAVFIGLRYLRAKQHSHFISLMSLISISGIALGITVLITVLSVMNGFDEEIKKRVFSMVPPLTITSPSSTINHWPSLAKKLQPIKAVTAIAPFIGGEVLLNYGGIIQPVILEGILPSTENGVTKLSSKMIQGQLSTLKDNSFGLVIGEQLANHLQVRVNDKLIVMTPQASLSPVGILPRYKRFTVVGIFSAGGGFGFDSNLAFTHLDDARRLFSLPAQAVTGLHVNINNVYHAPRLSNLLSTTLSQTTPHLPVRFTITTWADQFGAFFHAITLEKKMMFLILLLIIAVAAFNLVSMLVMVVVDKSADIAILRTMGATPRLIMSIFIVEGGMIGLLGTLVGLCGGLLLAWKVTDIVNEIQHLFNVQFLSASIYFVDYLPSKINARDVVTVSLIALILSLIATLYPAWRAAHLDPIQSLRHE